MSSALIIIPLTHSEALDSSPIARVLTTHLDCLTVWANVSWCPVRQGLNMHGHQSLPLPLLAQQEYLHPQEYSNGKSQLHTHPVRRWPTAIDTYCKGFQFKSVPCWWPGGKEGAVNGVYKREIIHVREVKVYNSHICPLPFMYL